MPANVQIKQFELSEQEALLSFLRAAYTEEPRKSDPAFWRWHFLEGPYVHGDDIPLWIAKAGEEVVGQLGQSPFALKSEMKSSARSGIRISMYTQIIASEDWASAWSRRRLSPILPRSESASLIRPCLFFAV